MFIVDAHLDLAYNAVRGRDLTRPAIEQIPDVEGIPSVSLPDLHAGHVGLICATIFCQPALPNQTGYSNAEEASTIAKQQLAWYRQQERDGRMRFLLHRADVPNGDGNGGAQDAILLLEGADAIRQTSDLQNWFDAGLRIIGLAWKRTRFAGGTGAPGPLTPEGIELVREIERLGIIHDTSHLAEESFWQLLDLSRGPIIASHSNCRSMVPTDRQLSDDMARALFARDGVVGINFFDKFLIPPGEFGNRRANLGDVVRHIAHFCQLAGDARHVGLGTDMDGGLGREQIPIEIVTSASLPRVADALSDAGFADSDVAGILGKNWLRFFRAHLPV